MLIPQWKCSPPPVFRGRRHGALGNRSHNTCARGKTQVTVAKNPVLSARQKSVFPSEWVREWTTSKELVASLRRTSLLRYVCFSFSTIRVWLIQETFFLVLVNFARIFVQTMMLRCVYLRHYVGDLMWTYNILSSEKSKSKPFIIKFKCNRVQEVKIKRTLSLNCRTIKLLSCNKLQFVVIHIIHY